MSTCLTSLAPSHQNHTRCLGEQPIQTTIYETRFKRLELLDHVVDGFVEQVIRKAGLIRDALRHLCHRDLHLCDLVVLEVGMVFVEKAQRRRDGGLTFCIPLRA